jgi:protoporphyrinogen oxidase
MSAALELQARGIDYALVERESEVGGHVVTLTENGYRFDRTGHLLHLRDERRRARTLALLDEPPLEFHRESLIYSEHVFTRYPYQSNTFGLPADVAYDCLLGFVRAYNQTPKPTPANFEDFCRIHFGDAVAERFMLPYNGRLWGVAPNEVTTDWCERFVPIPTLEDVLAGAVGKQRKELGYNATGFYPRRGIGELTQAMGRRLNALYLNTSPTRIFPLERRCGFPDHVSHYQTLISTLPLPSLLALIDGLPTPIERAARQLRCTQLYYLDVALKRAPQRPFHWIYVPETRFAFYRVGNYAAFSPDMAPPGAANLYVELAERSQPNLDELWPTVASGLMELGIIHSSDDVAFFRLRRLAQAYVIYDKNRNHALAQIHEYLTSHGIVSNGRYGGWNYSAMEDALRFGEEAVSRTIERLS